MKPSPLKDNHGFVRVKVEEVLAPIFIRGLLSLNEQQVVWWVIADSWRWEGSNVTVHPVTMAAIARATGIPPQHVCRVWQRLLARRIILEVYRFADRAMLASFNEHWETWLPARGAQKEPNWDMNQIGTRPKLVTSCNQIGYNHEPNWLQAPPEPIATVEDSTPLRTSKKLKNIRTTSGETMSRGRDNAGELHRQRSALLGVWRDLFLKTRGREYLLRPGEANAAARVIGDIGFDRACAAAGRLLESTDPWLAANASLAVLERQLNRFLEKETHGRNDSTDASASSGRYAHLHQPGGSVPARPDAVAVVGA